MLTDCSVNPWTCTSTNGLRTWNFNVSGTTKRTLPAANTFCTCFSPRNNFLVKYRDKFYLPVNLSGEMSAWNVITPAVCLYVCIYRFQNVVLRRPTPRLHCFQSSHWPSFRFLSFMAFLIPSIQFLFGLPCAPFCFGIHFNAILGNFPSAILWTWAYHVSWFCSISFIICSSNLICCLIVTLLILLCILLLKNRARSPTVCKPPIKYTVNYVTPYNLHMSVAKTRYRVLLFRDDKFENIKIIEIKFISFGTEKQLRLRK